MEVGVSHEELSQLIDHRCSAEDATALQAPVQAEEIKEMLLSMPTSKAPGLDGYPMEFYKAALSVIGKDFYYCCPIFLHLWFHATQHQRHNFILGT